MEGKDPGGEGKAAGTSVGPSLPEEAKDPGGEGKATGTSVGKTNRFTSLNIGEPTGPSGSCSDLPPTADDDRQVSTLTTASNEATHESKPASALPRALASYDDIIKRAMEGIDGHSEEEEEDLVEIVLEADGTEFELTGMSLDANDLHLDAEKAGNFITQEPVAGEEEAEEGEEAEEVLNYATEDAEEYVPDSFPVSVPRSKIQRDKARRKQLAKRERQKDKATTTLLESEERLPQPDPRGPPLALNPRSVGEVERIQTGQDVRDVEVGLNVKIHGKGQFQADLTTTSTPSLNFGDLVFIIDSILNNFVFLTVVVLKLFPAVDSIHRQQVFPKTKALLTFSDEDGKSAKSIFVKRSVRERLARMFMVRRGLTVDSGAADNVYPRSWVRQALIMISKGMREGLHYIAASGSRIPNEGEFMLIFWSKEGVKANLLFQLAAINKPLASVSNMTDNDYCVVFNKHKGRDVSYVLHKPSDQIMRLRRERGIYILDAWTEEEIKPPAETGKSIATIAKAEASFSRPR